MDIRGQMVGASSLLPLRGPGVWTQVIRLDDKGLYPLSYAARMPLSLDTFIMSLNSVALHLESGQIGPFLCACILSSESSNI